MDDYTKGLDRGLKTILAIQRLVEGGMTRDQLAFAVSEAVWEYRAELLEARRQGKC